MQAYKYEYDRESYRSPQRLRDAEGFFKDLWLYAFVFTLILPDKRKITVLPPFEYDKGSVPEWVQNWLQRDHRQAVIAFLIHDWLYHSQQIEGQWIARSEADKIFLDILRQEGMSLFKSWTAYMAVKSWGWRYWNPRAKAYGNTK